MKYWRTPINTGGWDYARASGTVRDPVAEYFDDEDGVWVRDDRYWPELHYTGDWYSISEADALAAIAEMVSLAS